MTEVRGWRCFCSKDLLLQDVFSSDLTAFGDPVSVVGVKLNF